MIEWKKYIDTDKTTYPPISNAPERTYRSDNLIYLLKNGKYRHGYYCDDGSWWSPVDRVHDYYWNVEYWAPFNLPEIRMSMISRNI